jgi:hypothetical protein
MGENQVLTSIVVQKAGGHKSPASCLMLPRRVVTEPGGQNGREAVRATGHSAAPGNLSMVGAGYLTGRLGRRSKRPIAAPVAPGSD